MHLTHAPYMICVDDGEGKGRGGRRRRKDWYQVSQTDSVGSHQFCVRSLDLL